MNTKTERSKAITKIAARVRAIDLMDKHFRQTPACVEANHLERNNLRNVQRDLEAGRGYNLTKGFITTTSATVVCLL